VIHALAHAAKRLASRLVGRPSASQIAERDPFDDTYGTDTARIVSVGALDIDDSRLAHSNRYEAVVPEMFVEIMASLPIVHKEFVFIDIGSGKGRALLLASRFPFAQIIGIELSASLTAIAANNIRIFDDPKMQCRAIRAECADGGAYIPAPVDTVLYLNNPFDEQVMQPLVNTLQNWLTGSRRRLYVIYQRPLCRAVFDHSPAFELVHTAQRYLIYRGRAPA
jgi:SAM-dependent methyltransferase